MHSFIYVFSFTLQHSLVKLVSILLKMKLRLREAKRLAQGHTASKDLIQDFKSKSFGSVQSFLTHFSASQTSRCNSLLPQYFVTRATCCYLVVTSFFNSLATPWTVAHQAPLSTGFSRQEYRSGLSLPSPGYLPYPGNKPVSFTERQILSHWAIREDQPELLLTFSLVDTLFLLK